jgi:translation initiation factor IF-1
MGMRRLQAVPDARASSRAAATKGTVSASAISPIAISQIIAISHEKTRTGSHRSPSSIARPGATGLRVRRIRQITQKDHKLPKEELLEFEGLVTEILPDARYRVQLDNGHALVAYTAGRMKKNRIKTLAGDRVTVEVSPYDLEKGRMIFRHRDERAGSVSRAPQRNQFRRR